MDSLLQNIVYQNTRNTDDGVTCTCNGTEVRIVLSQRNYGRGTLAYLVCLNGEQQRDPVFIRSYFDYESPEDNAQCWYEDFTLRVDDANNLIFAVAQRRNSDKSIIETREVAIPLPN